LDVKLRDWIIDDTLLEQIKKPDWHERLGGKDYGK
jgi:hypothetical protein